MFECARLKLKTHKHLRVFVHITVNTPNSHSGIDIAIELLQVLVVWGDVNKAFANIKKSKHALNYNSNKIISSSGATSVTVGLIS